jgi:hypothetical protein
MKDIQRDMMIDELVEAVDDWDIDTLIDFAKDILFDRYSKWKTHEIEEEYFAVLGSEGYPETFPEGYKEP